MLDTFVDIAPSPRSRLTDVREVAPLEDKMSGFIFKIHANLDPNHRDRIAFLRICSGTFERNAFYIHPRTGKKCVLVIRILFGRQQRGYSDCLSW